MRMIAEWRRIVRKAWSVRLMLLSGVLSGAEIVLPMFADILPRGLFSILTIIAVAGAFVARLTAQKDMQ